MEVYGTWKGSEGTKPLSIIFENSCQSNGKGKKQMCKEGEWGEVKEGEAVLLGRKRKWNPKAQTTKTGTVENLGRYFLDKS